jgi:hypothetical protein
MLLQEFCVTGKIPAKTPHLSSDCRWLKRDIDDFFSNDGKGTDSTPDLTITYDALGRKSTESSLLSSVSQSSVSYTYSATDGRLASIGRGDVSSPQSFSYLYSPSSMLVARCPLPVASVTAISEREHSTVFKFGVMSLRRFWRDTPALGSRTNQARNDFSTNG